jgi:acetyl esterase/lipase
MQSIHQRLAARGIVARPADGRRSRRDRRFRPSLDDGLETRAMLSASSIGGGAHPLLAMVAGGHAGHGSGHTFARHHHGLAHAAASHKPSQGHALPTVRTASSAWTLTSDVPYPTANGQSQLLDVYLPTAPTPPGGWPVMIAIHGGGWRSYDKTNYGPNIAAAFVTSGYAVVAPNYTLSQPGQPSWPTALQDLQAAVRWVRANAASLGFDPDRVIAVGESAGANLAALLGTASPGAGDAAVDAVVAFSTPADLASLYAQEPIADGPEIAQFLGGTPKQVPANYTAASPTDQVAPGDPPMLIIQGLQDPLIPVAQSQALVAALTAAGVRNQLLLETGGHLVGFPYMYSDLIPPILSFLQTI